MSLVQTVITVNFFLLKLCAREKHFLIFSVFILSIRKMHDPLLLPYVQTMFAKLVMNLVEPLMSVSKQGDEPVNFFILFFRIL